MDFDMEMPMMGDEMMVTLSLKGVSDGEADVPYDNPWEPLKPTIPVPLPSMSSRTSSQVDAPSDEVTIGLTSPHDDLSSLTASLPTAGMHIDDSMLSGQVDHLAIVCDETICLLCTGPGDWLGPHQAPSPPFWSLQQCEGGGHRDRIAAQQCEPRVSRLALARKTLQPSFRNVNTVPTTRFLFKFLTPVSLAFLPFSGFSGKRAFTRAAGCPSLGLNRARLTYRRLATASRH